MGYTVVPCLPRFLLQKRYDAAVWDAAAALRGRPAPLERYFGAEVLRLIVHLDESDEAPFEGPLVDLFLPWVAGEPDPRVAWSLTAGLADSVDPRAEVVLPELTRHVDGKVRGKAVSGLCRAIETGDPAVTPSWSAQGTKAQRFPGPPASFSPPRRRMPRRPRTRSLRASSTRMKSCEWRRRRGSRCATIRGVTTSFAASTPRTRTPPTTGCSTTCPGTATAIENAVVTERFTWRHSPAQAHSPAKSTAHSTSETLSQTRPEPKQGSCHIGRLLSRQ